MLLPGYPTSFGLKPSKENRKVAQKESFESFLLWKNSSNWRGSALLSQNVKQLWVILTIKRLAFSTYLPMNDDVSMMTGSVPPNPPTRMVLRASSTRKDSSWVNSGSTCWFNTSVVGKWSIVSPFSWPFNSLGCIGNSSKVSVRILVTISWLWVSSKKSKLELKDFSVGKVLNWLPVTFGSLMDFGPAWSSSSGLPLSRIGELLESSPVLLGMVILPSCTLNVSELGKVMIFSPFPLGKLLVSLPAALVSWSRVPCLQAKENQFNF